MRGLVGAAFLLGSISAAQAVDLNFSGNLSTVCTLGVPVAGTLGLAMDGLTVGSQEPGGTAASVTIVTLGTNKVTVTPPVWVTTPGSYVPGAEVREVAYSGLSGVGQADQTYTASSTSFNLVTNPVATMVVNARTRNSAGFIAGNYQMKVTVTCAPGP